MSEINEVRRAIAKLEDIRHASDGWMSTVQPSGYRGSLAGPQVAYAERVARFGALSEVAYGTLDAQLAIMRNYTEVYRDGMTPKGYKAAIVTLARAINEAKTHGAKGLS